MLRFYAPILLSFLSCFPLITEHIHIGPVDDREIDSAPMRIIYRNKPAGAITQEDTFKTRC